MNVLAALGAAIKEARVKRELSQEKLAEAAHVHRNVIGLIERGTHTLNLKSFIAIANGLGLRPSVLLARAEALAEAATTLSEQTAHPAD